MQIRQGSTIVINPPVAADAARTLRSRVPTSVPDVMFSDQRLDNGLRVLVAEDHLAPVVAVNLWYDVGSKHEVQGKTGFAHLFEHVMFQGSATSPRPSTSPSSRPPAAR